MKSTVGTFALAAAAALLPAAVYGGAVVNPNKLPHQSEAGMVGYNDCGTTDSASSMCQTAWIESIEDFCLFAPSKPGHTISDDERITIAWCTKSGHGARLIPKGTFTGIQYLTTPHYIQITGVGDLTKLDIKKGDYGGELDPHGYDGKGNPIGGLVLGHVNGTLTQFREWHMFIGADEFSFRACFPSAGDSLARQYCPHIYDEMGAYWNDPATYDSGKFVACKGNDGLIPGVYGTSTFTQGAKTTPAAHPIVTATSQCTTVKSITAYSYPKSSASTTKASTSTKATSTSKAVAKSSSTKASSSAAKPTAVSSVKDRAAAPTAHAKGHGKGHEVKPIHRKPHHGHGHGSHGKPRRDVPYGQPLIKLDI